MSAAGRAERVIDLLDLPVRDRYRWMTAAIVPRPIAWVGTRSPDGVDNLAPFSYFMGVASDPPLAAISVARGKGGALKDTARNLLEGGELTISLVPWRLLEPMHASSAPWPPEVSEFEAVGLTPRTMQAVAAPGVAEADLVWEARLERAIDLGSVHLFVVRLLLLHVAEHVLEEGLPAAARLDPAARLGGAYARLGPVTVLPPARVPRGGA